MSTYRYAGFLSYAHADEGIAARLHKALETFDVPKDLAASEQSKLSPIFRDTAELTAHHSLSEKIQEAVGTSRTLIVLCSPASQKSHWVNEEIKLFRNRHGESSILCVLAKGTPETSFPPALTEGGREPLAATLGTSRESFRLGVTQIAASMLGVGLDQLIQRDARRRRRRMQSITAAALLFSGVMGATALTAVQARTAADESREQAEELVEFMITDMKAQLEPVGRLEILDSVGEEAVKYYDAQDIKKLPDESLSRQARARHILGQVAIDMENYEKAKVELEAASRLTAEVFNRNPDDADIMFAHAQSEFWLGKIYYFQRDLSNSMIHWKSYADLGEQLYQKDPKNLDWVMEKAWGNNNVAFLHNRLENTQDALLGYQKSLDIFDEALRLAPENDAVKEDLANTLAGLSQLSVKAGNIEEALSFRNRQIRIYDDQLKQVPQNQLIQFRRVQARSNLIKDGMLDVGTPEYSSTIKGCLDQYEMLLNYDPKNERWKKSYISFLEFLNNKRDELGPDFAGSKSVKNRLKKFGIE